MQADTTTSLILQALAEGPATVRQLIERTGRCENAVERAVTPMHEMGLIRRCGRVRSHTGRGSKAWMYALGDVSARPTPPDVPEDVVEEVSAAVFRFTDVGREVTAGDVQARVSCSKKAVDRALKQLVRDGFLVADSVQRVTVYRKAPFVPGSLSARR